MCKITLGILSIRPCLIVSGPTVIEGKIDDHFAPFVRKSVTANSHKTQIAPVVHSILIISRKMVKKMRKMAFIKDRKLLI